MNPTLGRAAARGAAVFCLVFMAFQVALVLGAPFGRYAWGGAGPAVLPMNLRWQSVLAAVFLAIYAATMLVRSGDIGRSLPQRPFLLLNIVVTLQLALNTLANLASQSSGERYVMGSASLLGCLLCAAALTSRPRPAAG